MKNLSRRVLWGGLGAVVLIAIALIAVLLWGVGISNLPADAIRVPQDVPSLQEALALASSGATIAIQQSEEEIQGPIVIAISDLSIVAVGGRVSLNTVGADPAVLIQADGVILRGFDISSESTGIQVDASDCRLEDIHVESATVGIQLTQATRCALQLVSVSGGQIGLELIESGNTDVNDLTIGGASEYGVLLQGAWNNSLSNLSLTGNGVGIAIELASTSNVIEASAIEASSTTGIEIRSSNDNTISDTTITAGQVGISLEGVTGTEIRGCSVLEPAISGVVLQQAVKNRILETTIEGSQGDGIQLAQSAENALLTNTISGSKEAGIGLITSSRNLVMGNVVDGCSIGIHVSRSDDTRILRNTVSNAALSGFYLSQGKSNRLLDNSTSGGAFGLLISESGSNTILRNAFSGAEGAGMLLIDSVGDNHVSENEARGNVQGLVLAAAANDRFTQNQILNNDTGMAVTGLGSGVRIEGNTIAENDVGLGWVSNLDGLRTDLDALGIAVAGREESLPPILANNVFKGNERFDIQNETMGTLPAADNWWGTAISRDIGEAVVSDGVSLEQSSWKGVIAVGTGSDDVRVLLGRILQFKLTEAGFRVIDLVGMGPSDLVQQALADSDVDLIWWSGPTPDSQSSTVSAPSTVVSTSAVQGWSIIVSSQLGSQLASATVSGLAAWVAEAGTPLRYAATSGLGEDAFDAFLAAYGLENAVRSFTQSDALEEVEALLKFGAVDVAVIGSLQETLTRSGFLAIADDLHLLAEDPISMIVQQTISTKYAEIWEILAVLGEQLTTDVLHDLVSRIRLLHQEPEDVARAFLQAGM